LIGLPEFFQFYDPGFIPYSPGNNLPGVFLIICLDDCPAAVLAIVAAPLKVMQIPCGVDFFDNGLAVVSFVR